MMNYFSLISYHRTDKEIIKDIFLFYGEEIGQLVVKQNGYLIRFIENPSIEVQKLAVKSDEYNIKYIKNPSMELQILAVTKNYNVLKIIS